MISYSKPNRWIQNEISHNVALAGYLHGLTQGREMTPRSWLYESQPADVVLQKWLKHLEPLARGNEFEQIVYHFDSKQVEKFGPQGGIPPIKEALQVESFQEQYILNKPVTLELPTLSNIFKSSEKLEYWDLSKVYDSMSSRDTLETNSGFPLFTRRKKVRHQEEYWCTNGTWKSFPAIILFRYYNGKLRVVWMYPMSANLREYLSTIPIQNWLRTVTKYVTPWAGFEHVKVRFTELWKLHPYAFGGDTTAMDAHMQLSQLMEVGNMCADLFVDPTTMLETLQHVANIDLLVGPETIIRGQQHGIASGSGWTQLSETIFQIGMFKRFINMHHLPLTPDDGMGIGDDYVWFFDDKPDEKEIVEFWDANGLPGKPEKQSNEERYCTFLQRLFYKGFFSRDDSTVLGGIYPTVRALNSLLNPERFHDPRKLSRLGINYSDLFCARTFMILENTVDHPLFEEFCKFVVRGHKDLLPFAKSLTDRKIDAIYAVGRKVPGFNPSYNQEKMDKPMSEFTSIKYARSL